MGGELVNSPASPISYSEFFHMQFPFYLSIGMTYDQYWNMDATLVKDYREANFLRNKYENEKMWLQGLYFLQALNASVGNMFLKIGQKPCTYPEEPFPRTKEEVEEKQRRENEAKIASFKAKISSINSKFKSV